MMKIYQRLEYKRNWSCQEQFFVLSSFKNHEASPVLPICMLVSLGIYEFEKFNCQRVHEMLSFQSSFIKTRYNPLLNVFKNLGHALDGC